MKPNKLTGEWEDYRQRALILAEQFLGKGRFKKIKEKNPNYPDNWEEIFAILFSVYRLTKGGEQGLFTDLRNFITSLLSRHQQKVVKEIENIFTEADNLMFDMTDEMRKNDFEDYKYYEDRRYKLSQALSDILDLLKKEEDA